MRASYLLLLALIILAKQSSSRQLQTTHDKATELISVETASLQLSDRDTTYAGLDAAALYIRAGLGLAQLQPRNPNGSIRKAKSIGLCFDLALYLEWEWEMLRGFFNRLEVEYAQASFRESSRDYPRHESRQGSLGLSFTILYKLKPWPRSCLQLYAGPGMGFGWFIFYNGTWVYTTQTETSIQIYDSKDIAREDFLLPIMRLGVTARPKWRLECYYVKDLVNERILFDRKAWTISCAYLF